MTAISSIGTGGWNVSTTWNPAIVPGVTDDVTIGVASVTVTVSTSEFAELLAVTAGVLALAGNAGSLVVGQGVGNSGSILVNDSFGGDGGSSVTIGGTLSNTGNVYLGPGNNSLAGSDTIAATALANTGNIYLYGAYGSNTANQALLAVSSSAPGTLTGNYDLSGDAVLRFVSGGITAITGSVGENSANSRIALASAVASNSALATLASLSGQLYLDGGAVLATTTNLAVSGNLNVDNRYGGEGGSSVTIGGTLTNTGNVYLGPGNNSLVGSDTIAATALANTGNIYLYGAYGSNTANQALLAVSSAAPGTLTGSYDLSGDAVVRFASGGITSIVGFLGENSANSRIALAGTVATNSALTTLASLSGQFYLDGGAVLTTTTNLAVSGNLHVDNRFGGDGGSSVTIGGTLSNTGNVYLGPGNNSLAGSDTIAATALANTGNIYLYGAYGSNTANQALLAVSSSAPGTLIGNYDLSGDAIVRFDSGTITSITGFLAENSANSRVALAGAAATNSALAMLASLSGQLYLDGGAVLATTTNLAVSGNLNVDNRYGGDGGSSVTIGGTLINTGNVYLGPGNNSLVGSDTIAATALANTGNIYLYGAYGSNTANQALLAVSSAAPGTLTGSYDLSGDAVVRFASGGITSIVGFLGENSANSRIALAGTVATNSALTTLASLSGQFYLDGGAVLTTTTNLAVSGNLHVDNRFGGDGGSSVTIGGTLSNTGNVYLGPGNNSLAGSDTIAATALANTGNIYLYGAYGSNTANQALLAVSSSAPGTLTGNYDLSGDAVLRFVSGGITAITGSVGENSANSRIALASAVASNSALATLASLSGQLYLDGGAVLATTTNLAVSGNLNVDNRYGGEGGSSVTIGGTLTNTGNVYLGPGNNSLVGSDTLSASVLVNSGNLTLYGSGSGSATFIARRSAGNLGAVTINPGATLAVTGTGTYAQSSGATSVAGLLSAGTVVLTGGSLDGGGTVTAAVVNSGGTLFGGPPGSIGTLKLNGAYTQGGSGELDFAVEGLTAGDTGLVINTGGLVTLNGGTLRITTPTNFQFAAGESFTVMKFAGGSLKGTFGALAFGGTTTSNGSAIDLGDGTIGQVIYDNAGGQIQLVTVTSLGTLSPANGAVTPPTVAIGAAHTGDAGTVALTVANAAGPSSAFLDATIAGITGQATAGGTASLIGAGQSTNTALRAGISTSTDGVKAGSVIVALASDAADGTSALPLASQTVSVSGTVYNEAVATVTVPANLIAHAGEHGTLTLTITNAAPADGFSETLRASLAALSGGVVTGTVGTALTLAPGASDATSIALAYTAPLTSGVVTTDATLSLVSDGTGIDSLGTTALASLVVPVSITVDNPAQAAFEKLTGPGTITGAGSSFTLDLGAIAQATGPFVLDLGIGNVATGPADLLSGGLTSAGAFSASGLAAFSGVPAGSADVAPTLTLDTTTAGVYTQTVTLSPTGGNAAGYSSVLPAETLTVTGTVAPLSPLTIAAPATVQAFVGISTQLGTITIADPNGSADPVTVTISDASGTLAAVAAGSGAVGGSGSNRLTLSGTAAEIDTMLAGVMISEAQPGSDVVTLRAGDTRDAIDSLTIAVSVGLVPFTAPMITAPGSQILLDNTTTSLGGIKVSDPYAEANGQILTLTAVTNIGSIGVSGPAGASITYVNGNTLTITGTVQQINADLGDALNIKAGLVGFAIAGYALASGFLGQLAVEVAGAPPGEPGYYASGQIQTPQEFNIEAINKAQEALNDAIETAGEAIKKAGEIEEAATVIVEEEVAALDIGDAHISTFGGQFFDFNAVGEFVLAKSTLSSNAFQVQARLSPWRNSASATVISQVAATVGNDRVSVGIGRAAAVYLNGSPITPVAGATVNLSGGRLTTLTTSSFQITWNTGESLTVIDNGSYLDVRFGLGVGDGPGSTAGLLGPNDGAANDFTLPDGTVLAQPLTSTQLYATFGNAWRVTQASSLFDYGAGETTATFTDLSAPRAAITLADLPASVVAQARSLVAAAGITNPTAVAAALFDYLATGDLRFIGTDSGALVGLITQPATIAASGATTPMLGIAATQSSIIVNPTVDTQVTFGVYLTSQSTADTLVSYAAVVAQAGDLTAAAFGGSLPAGTVTITHGQTSAQVTIDLPAGALALAQSGSLDVEITAPNGTAIFAPSAQVLLSSPQPGARPVPQISYLGKFGDFSALSDTSYNLDLGPIALGEPVPALTFAIKNAASAPADELGGSISYATVAGFSVAGAGAISPIMPGASYSGLAVTLTDDKFGPNSETLVFSPTDTNAAGYSAVLPNVTLDVTYTFEAPTTAYSEAWGDVHIITYNGLRYDFQAIGEFVLAHSTAAGDSFDIQLRLQQWYSGALVSIITQVAMSLGTDRVTLDLNRANFLAVDGAAVTMTVGASMTLSGGTLTELSSTSYKLKWNTGETATITNAGQYLNVTDSFPVAETGTISGIQGENEGQSRDFQLPDGTVLPQPLSKDTLYGQFADAWRVSDTTSLFDYAPGQNTAFFTDRNFPSDVVQLADLPAAVVANAAAMVTAAGITDPGIAQAAELDYIATNDPHFIATAANVQQAGFGTVAATVTAAPALPLVGVSATAAKVTQAASGATSVMFNVFLTAVANTDTQVTYIVNAPDGSYLGADAFGGTLPSGQVTIPAGQTAAQVTISIPQDALGTAPAETLGLRVSAPGGNAIFAPIAQTQVINSQPEPGDAPAFELLSLGGIGAFTHLGNTYTLDLGNVARGSLPSALQFAIANTAASPADDLSGTFSFPTGTGFVVSGNSIRQPIAAGQTYAGLYFVPRLGTVGSNSMTLSFTPTDVNDSGNSQALTPVTLTVVDSVIPPADAALNTPDTVVFPNVRVGTADRRVVSITNTAASPASNLDVTPAARSDATATGSIVALAPGATDATSIRVGLSTAAPGPRSGFVTLMSGSDSGGGGTASASALSDSPVVNVFGSVYRPATASTIAPVTRIVHVGDPGGIMLAVANTATADGYSESLVATVASLPGGFGGVGATTGDVAAGGVGSLALAYSTVQAATLAGSVTVTLATDGGIGAGAIDGLGTLALGGQSVGIAVTVDSYAAPLFEKLGGAGVLTVNGTAATLDLGSIVQGGGAVSASFGVLNAAAGPADALSGSFTASSSSSQITTAGLTAFTGLAAGQADTAPVVTLDSSQAGTVSQTITLTPAGSNASGYSGVLAAQTLTVVGTITAAQTITPPLPIILGGLLPFAALSVNATDPNGTPSVTATLTPAVPGIYSNLGGGALDPTGTVYTTTQTATEDTQALGGATFGTTQDGFPLLGVSATINGGAGFNSTLFDTGQGTDFITAGYGNDTLFVLPGRATLRSGPGNDLLYAIGPNDTLIGGTGASTMVGGSSATTFLLGDASQVVFDGGGAATIVGGAGSNTIVGLSGNDTITLGTGGNLVGVAQGNNLIASIGADTLIAGAGADTVLATGNVLGFGGAGQLLFFNGGGISTVFGASGAGSATIDGGAGGGLFGGARGGNNLITAGQQTTTIFGAAGGDTLNATGSAADVLVAGSGNETLNGANSSGANIFFAGSGADCIVAGGGNSVVVASTGNATVNLGPGNDVVAFINAQGGGASLINNFQLGGDKISLQGFASDVQQAALGSATVIDNSITFTLPDNTRITLANVSTLANVFA